MDDEGYHVSSEIFDEKNYIISKPPTFDKSNVVSKFNFIQLWPRCGLTIDADGDLNVPRKNSKVPTDSIEIEHKKSTVLGMVGLQIWRGALLLADWFIYNHDKIPKESYILELGSGVGFTSIVASMFFPVVCTDIDRGDILGLIESNVQRNKNHVKNPVKVLELDFMSEEIPKEVLEHLPDIPLIIAADTIYDDVITEAFIRTVDRLLSSFPRQRSICIALEKRYVFTMSDCDTVAPCYEHFLECLGKLTNVKCEEAALNFPKYFEYDRVKELVLWKVTSLL